MTLRSACCVVMLLGSSAGITLSPMSAMTQPQTPSMPVFKAGVDRVTFFATVHDRRGRLVPNLLPGDFELMDAGTPRSILEVRSDRAPVSLALLVDVSGSMAVGSNLRWARLAGQQVLSSLEPQKDEAALFTFDTELRELTPFSTSADELRDSLESVTAFGATSLWDAIAAAARRVAERGGQRPALVVLTDGADTSSRWSAHEVSGFASVIDVPVYIIATQPLVSQSRRENLANLAAWTGGELHAMTAPEDASTAARRIVDELRHQYFFTFDASATPGWHSLVVRTRNRALSVRARSGYFVGN